MLTSLKIGQRLAVAFALMTALVCAVGGLGMYQAARINDGADQLGNSWLPSIKLLSDLENSANTARRAALNHVLESTPERKSARMATMDKALKEDIPSILESYSKVITSPEEQKLYEEIKVRLATWSALNSKLIAESDAGEPAFAQARQLAAGEGAEAFLALEKVIAQDVKLNETGANRETKTAAATYHTAVSISVALLAAAVAFAGLLAWAIMRSITVPLRKAVQVAKAVAAGDLTTSIVSNTRDEIGQLLESLSEMNESLARIVGQVRDSSDSIATGSAQIATGNADLSQRTEEQASNLQQTAASMEEISGTIKTSAETAGQANQLAASASAAALKGGEMVGTVVSTMQEIAASSKKISDIIGVIDGIAFQTNILALNAAVEAARAGEQGRGFAVVASEVRNLAGRSAEAAKEIKTLIGASVNKVEAGTRQVNDAGASMTEIVTQVQRVGQMISELSNAAHEQSVGINQVGEAVTQLDQVTQQNAALVEECAAAAESLKHQAARLADMVSIFRIGSDTANATASPVERRGPNRATNVTRPAFQARPPKSKAANGSKVAVAGGQVSRTGTDDWTTF